ncbi:MAG: NTP transferase domain-containing protein [Gemmatimonadetes bacterium]|nr:NTP transferase domain-containing protein [Gemmatimonadota bacterium]
MRVARQGIIGAVDGDRHTWALVLAAGDGTRLRELTTTSTGISIPKQFCSLRGGPSLLDDALGRAESIACRERICTVVAEYHRQWWEPALVRLPRQNVIVQPGNRGTGNGTLLPLLHILRRDRQARIVLLPSDHHVRDESTLERSLRQALAQLAGHRTQVVMLGVEPDKTDPELGYIVPGRNDGTGLRTVERFVEKPPEAIARELIADGAVWNAFIAAARAQALLGLFARRFPGVVARMRAAVAGDAGNPDNPAATRELYRTLPEIDFSRHIAEGSELALRVLTVPVCGWSDLGTPARVLEALMREPPAAPAQPGAVLSPSSQLNLAARHA